MAGWVQQDIVFKEVETVLDIAFVAPDVPALKRMLSATQETKFTHEPTCGPRQVPAPWRAVLSIDWTLVTFTQVPEIARHFRMTVARDVVHAFVAYNQ